MRRSLLLGPGLALGALAWLAAVAPAADLDKYLPDDAQMVVVVNVKQITAWTPFQKQIQDQIQQLLKADEAQKILKDTGFDPLHDIDRLVVVAAADSYKIVTPPPPVGGVKPGGANPPPPPPVIKPLPPGNPPAPPAGVAAPPPPPVVAPPAVAPPPPPPPGSITTSSGSPVGFVSFILVQGKFDADKLEAKAQQALKDHPDGVKKPRMVGGIELWEIAPGVSDHIYLAMLDKNTLMATGLESQALEALDKANGKRKTEIKDKQVRDALAKLDPKAAVQEAASGDLVTSVSMKSDGKGGFTTTTQTFHDQGVEGFHGAVTLGDADMHGEFTLTVKDADKAKEMAKQANDGLEMGIQNVTAAAQQMKDLLPIVDAMKTVKITATGDTITVEGSATPDAVQAGVKAFFTLTSSSTKPPQPPGVRPPDDVGKPDAAPPAATPPAPKKDK